MDTEPRASNAEERETGRSIKKKERQEGDEKDGGIEPSEAYRRRGMPFFTRKSPECNEEDGGIEPPKADGEDGGIEPSKAE